MLEEYLLDLGIELPKNKITDSNIIRWGKNNRYYAIRIEDGFQIGDWIDGQTWFKFPCQDSELTPWDMQSRKEARELAKMVYREEKEKRQKEVAGEIKEYMQRLKKGKTYYSERKEITDHFLIDKDSLIIPLKDINGNITTYQRITNNDKKLAYGGKAKGSFYQFGDMSNELYIAEGFATAWTVWKATGKTTLMAYSVGNIEVLVDLFKDKKITICADNDIGKDKNVGLDTALKLKEVYGVNVVYPPIDRDWETSTSMLPTL